MTSGAFRFGGLDPDRYGVRVSKSGYREAFRFVAVKSGEADPIVVTLTPFAEISGRVLDEEGHAMGGVLVYGRTSLLATSDRDGAYRIGELSPGEYVLAFRMPIALREATLERKEDTGEVFGYGAVAYYPGVTVAAGMHLRGYEIRLRRERLVEFKGRVVEMAGAEPLRTAAVQLDPGDGLEDATWQRRIVNNNGGFRFELIAPGRYSLLVYRDGATQIDKLAYRVPVNVGAGGVADAEVRVPRNVDLALKVTLPHPEKPVEGGVLVVVDRASVLPSWGLCRPHADCAVHDIPPGRWSFRLTAGMRETGDAPRRLYVAAFRLGEQNAWGAPVTVAEGGNPPFEVVFTDEVGFIEAAVTTEDGQPAEYAVLGAVRVGGDGSVPPAGPMSRGRGEFKLEGLLARRV
jgi:hypothetical protein